MRLDGALPSPVSRLPSLLEAYVDSLDAALAAEANGADRLELCGPGDGGLTPSPGLLRAVMERVRIPVHMMVRPREGDFCYSAVEFEAMRSGVVLAMEAHAAGVVFGILRADRTLDEARMRELVTMARGVPHPVRVACHRAFDRTPDADIALETLHALDVDLVLTSGHAPTALEGAATLARHVRSARERGDRLTILAGGSVRAENAAAIVAATGVRELHARATDPVVFASLVRALRP